MNSHVKSHAMQWRSAMVGNGLFMFPRRIALVLFPIVNGILLAILFHHHIPSGLGQDGSCRDGLVLGVAAHNANMLHLLVRIKSVAIDEQQFWLKCQLIQSPVHR